MAQATLETSPAMPAALTSPIDMDTLAAMHALRNTEVVRRFLNTHDYVLPLLLQAPQEIHRVFGQGTPLALWVAHDYDSGPESDELVIAIHVGEGWQEGEAKLRRLQENWWFGVLPQTQGKLDVDLDIGAGDGF